MKKLLIPAAFLCLAFTSVAQSPVDAMSLSQTELRGSARFTSMGGAFTALGADLSAIGQNPAGIGAYRGSDIGITLGIDINSDKTAWNGGSNSEDNTYCNVNNAGYVGTYLFGNNNENSFSWGFTFDRRFRFNRSYAGGLTPMETSLSNYIASLTNGVNPYLLNKSDSYDPYDNYSSDAPDWMSVLYYNSGMINTETYMDNGQVVETDSYRGLWQYGGTDNDGNNIAPTAGQASFQVREHGHADEYNISFGGSVMNLLYWGIGVGIADLDFRRDYWYAESMERALVPADPRGYELGNANVADLHSYQQISGTGANFKIGLILKPVNEFRIGLAVHTPTYYSLSSSSYGDTQFNFSNGFTGSEETPWDDYDFKLNTPWKLMAGVAGVIGGRGIISLDYQYDAYNNMKLKWDNGDNMTYNNNNISNYYKGTHTIRVGAEYRITPQLSARAGFNYSTTACKNEFKDANLKPASGADAMMVSTAGSNPSYTVSDDVRNITLGLGYRFSGFYLDFAYVNRHNTAKFNAFTRFVDYDGEWSTAPTAKLTHNSSQLVFTVGYRF